MLRQIERSAIKRLAERGQSQRAIAQELDDSRMTVALAEPIEQVPAKRERASIADPYRPQIERWLEAGLAAVRVLELARSDPEPAVPGGRSVFSEAVRPVPGQPRSRPWPTCPRGMKPARSIRNVPGRCPSDQRRLGTSWLRNTARSQSGRTGKGN